LVFAPTSERPSSTDLADTVLTDFAPQGFLQPPFFFASGQANADDTPNPNKTTKTLFAILILVIRFSPSSSPGAVS
jgi:hypothetical protein